MTIERKTFEQWQNVHQLHELRLCEIFSASPKLIIGGVTMKLFITIITILFAFESATFACKNSHGSSNNKKTGNLRHANSKSSLNKRVPASIPPADKDLKIAKRHSRLHSELQTHSKPLPKKKVAKGKSKGVREVASTAPHKKKSSVVPKQNKVAKRKKADPVQPLIEYLNEQDSDRQNSIDGVNVSELDGQSTEEAVMNGNANVSKDRAKITAEDPVLNEENFSSQGIDVAAPN
jgi:hypothetical protein